MTQTEQVNGATMVKPTGDIVASRVEQFRRELQDLVTQGNKNLVIDLSGVSMIDSKGLAVFMLCHKTVSAAGGSLTVVTRNEDFRQLFHIMRMDEHFRIAESV